MDFFEILNSAASSSGEEGEGKGEGGLKELKETKKIVLAEQYLP